MKQQLWIKSFSDTSHVTWQLLKSDLGQRSCSTCLCFAAQSNLPLSCYPVQLVFPLLHCPSRLHPAALRARQIMVDMPDTGELLRFVQKPNNIDLGDAVQVLSQHGMYAELAALYRCNGRHVEGLELLRRVSQEPQCLDVAPRGAAAGEG